MSDGRKTPKESRSITEGKRNFFASMSGEVIKSLKLAAVEDDTTASEILEQAARDWLERRKAKRKS
ncbi:hypothetical protein AC629_01865 [Bradyrhizobium sp. NAS80.1]|uniref:hypothetical protein n=1 Tax=Bradyrhizobium sp. NAS80.1 TaxID=1680159 RepID=UPI00095B8F4B|nr:hypothetical protein [Bradyrhizobium sp. NAS80.1]OKO91795.1 hypothetical protein AC629_01865 [Bradyrhizobium sp. NAS80.1]